MHVFKTKGIVLKVQKQGEKDKLYKVFFYDYGVLYVKNKKKTREKSIDIGYLIQCEIITKSEKEIHTIGNIKILGEFSSKDKSYEDIEYFLRFIGLLHKELPKGSPFTKVFELCEVLLGNKEKHSKQYLLLSILKCQSYLGNLGEKHKDMTVQKILTFIHTTQHREILRLGEIPKEALKQLEELL